MEIHRFLFLLFILCCRFDLASGQTDVIPSRAPNIRTVPSETLTDLAVAFADSLDPVIYYNPRLMNQYGAEMSAFVLAHEYAHIDLGHRRPGSVVARDVLERLLQGWELEADCLAATRLAGERPRALQAAIAFFERMAFGRVDREHPIGSARAARLAACGRGQWPVISGQGSGGPGLTTNH